MPATPKRATLFRRLSMGLLTFAALSFALQPDLLAPLTFWPPWVWCCAGSLLWLLSLERAPLKRQAPVAVGWLVFALLFGEWLPLLRTEPDAASTLRVLTANDAHGEIAAHAPDVALLTESPAQAEVESVARQLGASALWSPDASIIARGRLARVAAGPHYLAATLVRDGRTLLLICLRLRPPRLPFPTGQRAAQRQQLAPVLALIDASDADGVIVGGDFNVPSHDAVLSPLAARCRSVFRVAGRGWGGTVTNAIPVARFDQIWIAGGLRAHDATAHSTASSDHRLLRAELR